jgi:serine/threonine protein kinase
MGQITEALVYLQHESRNIIYKDLKPSNIIIDEDQCVKIIDFGISRRFDPKKDKDTHILGTPGYAPPEAYTETQTDFSADVYSLGAAFYHLTTGQEPVQFAFNFPDPRNFNPELTEEFAGLLMDCLKKREGRIKNGRELKERIGKIEEKRGGSFNNQITFRQNERVLNPSTVIWIAASSMMLLILGLEVFKLPHAFSAIILLVVIFMYPIIILLTMVKLRWNTMDLVVLTGLYIAFLLLLMNRIFFWSGHGRLR